MPVIPPGYTFITSGKDKGKMYKIDEEKQEKAIKQAKDTTKELRDIAQEDNITYIIGMSGKLTREQLKGLTAEQKIEYQRKQNAERVAKYRAANKEKAAQYNREYKKDYINRPENRDKYKELNKMYVNKYKQQQREVLKTLTIISANRNVDKLTKNEKEAKKAIEEGRAIMERLMKK